MSNNQRTLRETFEMQTYENKRKEEIKKYQTLLKTHLSSIKTINDKLRELGAKPTVKPSDYLIGYIIIGLRLLTVLMIFIIYLTYT